MFAINFYSEAYADMLKKGRKTATIRLGDKSDKYQSGQIVWVTVGRKYGTRQKIFTAIIDNVTVKHASELTPREIEKESPELRHPEDIINLLSRIYDRPVTSDDMVTIVQFSKVIEWELP
ncbi:MAG: ASCH domain-containing protein [Armatimonadota bacterium]